MGDFDEQTSLPSRVIERKEEGERERERERERFKIMIHASPL